MHSSVKIQVSKDREIDLGDIWNYACREIQQSLEKEKVNNTKDRAFDSSQQKVKSLINLLRLDAFAETPVRRIASKKTLTSRRHHRELKQRRLHGGVKRSDMEKRRQLNLSNELEVETPRRRNVKHIKHARRSTKQQIQQNYKLALNKSQPHGDEASLAQSHTSILNNEEEEVLKQVEKPVESASETLTIAIENFDVNTKLDESVSEFNSTPFELHDPLTFTLDEDDLSMSTCRSRISTILSESISMIRGFKVKKGLLGQIESMSNLTRYLTLEGDFLHDVYFTTPNYVCMAPLEVASKLNEPQILFNSHLIIPGSVEIFHLSKLTAKEISKHAEISVIPGCQVEKICINQQTVSCSELQNLKFGLVEPIPSIQWMYIDNLTTHDITEGDTEVSLLDCPVISTSLISESGLIRSQDSFACTCSSSYLSSELTTTSHSSPLSSETVTNYWIIMDNSIALETEQISDLDSVQIRPSCSVPQVQIRRMSMRWAMGSCLFMSSLFICKCFYTELLRGDWLSILGIISALCTIVLVSFTRRSYAS